MSKISRIDVDDDGYTLDGEHSVMWRSISDLLYYIAAWRTAGDPGEVTVTMTASALRRMAKDIFAAQEAALPEDVANSCPPGAYANCPSCVVTACGHYPEVARRCWRWWLEMYAMTRTDGQEWHVEIPNPIRGLSKHREPCAARHLYASDPIIEHYELDDLTGHNADYWDAVSEGAYEHSKKDATKEADGDE